MITCSIQYNDDVQYNVVCITDKRCRKKKGQLTSCVLICVGDKFNEWVGRVTVQIMTVPCFLGRDLYTRLGENFRYGRRDFTEMSVVRVRIQERHLHKKINIYVSGHIIINLMYSRHHRVLIIIIVIITCLNIVYV